MPRSSNRLPLLVVMLLASSFAGCGAGPPERIILIVVDTLRRDHVGAYGGPATPAMDGLARSGQAVENAFASFHQTSMSMGALFTGRTPSLESGDRRRELPWNSETWCGMARFRTPDLASDVCIGPGTRTLADSMRELGYRTLGVVSNPLLFEPLGYERGFDQWIEVGGPVPSPKKRRPRHREEARLEIAARLRSAEKVNDAVRALLQERQTDRFFLYLHYMDVHDYGRQGSSYAQSVLALDRSLAELLAFLDAEGLAEDALVLLVSDHGQLLEDRYPLPVMGHLGNPSFDPLLRIPLIASRKIIEPEDQLVRTQDLPGILTRIAGGDAAPPAGDLEADELFLTEMHYQTYRRGRWKSTWSRHRDAFYLFDLERDPAEGKDVAADHPDVVAAHRARIETLADRLSAAHGSERAELSPDEEERLRSLGYIE